VSPGQIIVRATKKPMRQRSVLDEDTQALENMIEVYEPTHTVVMLYLSADGEESESMLPQTDPTPQECYRMLQQKT
jgi:hypothetical protein